MAYRICEGMRELKSTPISGEGQTVELDETYAGGKEKKKRSRRGRQAADLPKS
jgi:hypothetical protein